MRRYGAWIINGIFVIGAFLLLCHAGNNLKKITQLERLAVYDLKISVDGESAGTILEQAAFWGEEESAGEGAETDAGEYSHNMIFFREQKEKTLENTAWYRQTETDVVEICGDSTLLFSYGYPLEPGDTKGCLLGEETALALFGGRQVIGEQVSYEGTAYEIRGILQGKNIFVIQADENTPLCNAGIMGNTVMERNKIAGQLQNAYGIIMDEVPFRFYGTIIRMEIFVLCAVCYIWAGWHLCHGIPERKAVKKAFILAGVLLAGAGIVFVMSMTAETMPDRISDMSWWGNYFSSEWEKWNRFWGSEKMFLQEEFQKCVLLMMK